MSEKKQKKDKKVFSASETIILVIISLLIGLSIGLLCDSKNIKTNMSLSEDKYLNEFVKNYRYVIDNYYKEVDRESLINSAISGMMKSLDDPYSVYFDEEETNNFSIALDGSYKGLGVQIAKDPSTGYMFIVSILKDSPAEKSDLKIGDLIVSINGKEAKDMTASEFSYMIKNSSENEFDTKVLRDGEEIELVLNKSTVTLTSVVSETYEENNKKIGYIYIGIFANNTLSQFEEELSKLEKSNIDYLIIDVRSNTGGHLTTVDGILDLFLNKDHIMYQFEQSGKKTSVYGTGIEKKNYEIILLGDEISASASEVLIAGLRDNLNSKFIGKKTYGKGTVQELVTLSDGTQYKITVKKWLTPKGEWINDTEGLTPDIEVDMDSKYFETYDTNDDTQLQAALKYIKENN